MADWLSGLPLCPHPSARAPEQRGLAPALRLLHPFFRRALSLPPLHILLSHPHDGSFSGRVRRTAASGHFMSTLLLHPTGTAFPWKFSAAELPPLLPRGSFHDDRSVFYLHVLLSGEYLPGRAIVLLLSFTSSLKLDKLFIIHHRSQQKSSQSMGRIFSKISFSTEKILYFREISLVNRKVNFNSR